MRRKDREIKDFNEIIHIIDACDVIRIGLADGDFPYIVPLNFGYEVVDQQIYFYIHGAMAGRKYEMITKSPVCSFEMDIPIGISCFEEKGDVTMKYKSVMGRAQIELLDGDEKEQAMDRSIMGRYEITRAFINKYNKAMLKRTMVARLKVIDITAKANL